MGEAWINQIGTSVAEGLDRFMGLVDLNSSTLSELTSPNRIEPIPLFAEQLFSGGRLAFSSVSHADSFSPMGPNSGGGRGLA